jgi:hypothetical protein
MRAMQSRGAAPATALVDGSMLCPGSTLHPVGRGHIGGDLHVGLVDNLGIGERSRAQLMAHSVLETAEHDVQSTSQDRYMVKMAALHQPSPVREA